MKLARDCLDRQGGTLFLEGEMRVKDIPKDAVLVNSARDVNYILRHHLGRKCSKYRSLFVIVEDGDYGAVWGCKYNIPYDDDKVRRLPKK
jgi:hypothetical protein